MAWIEATNEGGSYSYWVPDPPAPPPAPARAAPTKTITPVRWPAPAPAVAAPVAVPAPPPVAMPAPPPAVQRQPTYPAGAVRWSDLPDLGGVAGWKATSAQVNKLAGAIGYTGPKLRAIGTIAGGSNEAGETIYWEQIDGPTPGLLAAFEPLRFVSRAEGRGGIVADVYGPAGMLTTIELVKAQSSLDAFLESAVTVAIAVGTTWGLGSVLGVFAPAAGAAAQPAAAGIAAAEAAPAFVFNAAVDSAAASTALGITGSQAAAAAIVPAAVDLGTLGGILSTAAPAAAVVPEFAWNAAADSQAASTALGITGSQAAAAAVVPAAVDLGTLGGILSTAAPAASGTLAQMATKAADAAVSQVTAAAKAAVLGALAPDNTTPTTTGPAAAAPGAQPSAQLLAVLLLAAAVFKG